MFEVIWKILQSLFTRREGGKCFSTFFKFSTHGHNYSVAIITNKKEQPISTVYFVKKQSRYLFLPIKHQCEYHYSVLLGSNTNTLKKLFHFRPFFHHILQWCTNAVVIPKDVLLKLYLLEGKVSNTEASDVCREQKI